jgi:minor curlin subunit
MIVRIAKQLSITGFSLAFIFGSAACAETAGVSQLSGMGNQINSLYDGDFTPARPGLNAGASVNPLLGKPGRESSSNSATITQGGYDNSATISQNGAANTAATAQYGSNLKLDVTQNGNRMGVSVSQLGIGSGQSTTVTQTGAGVSPSTSRK